MICSWAHFVLLETTQFSVPNFWTIEKTGELEWAPFNSLCANDHKIITVISNEPKSFASSVPRINSIIYTHARPALRSIWTFIKTTAWKIEISEFLGRLLI